MQTIGFIGVGKIDLPIWEHLINARAVPNIGERDVAAILEHLETRKN